MEPQCGQCPGSPLEMPSPDPLNQNLHLIWPPDDLCTCKQRITALEFIYGNILLHYNLFISPLPWCLDTLLVLWKLYFFNENVILQKYFLCEEAKGLRLCTQLVCSIAIFERKFKNLGPTPLDLYFLIWAGYVTSLASVSSFVKWRA
jgi:hypothetical protein